ncbi:hypothetical protein PHMEG_0005066 [Phytophthora megakarya]|uniref:PiggyBac transposable element-derived protein domain-containing protein n=1 Tax=Phytophthora megakarya TaxID=4795 RepID=A0A225WTU5_9STRA|nr:hypothetical protein PHMEG_0005066 [Phytophthora megakarya]
MPRSETDSWIPQQTLDNIWNEGQARQRSKQYACEYGEGTVAVLRQAKHYGGAGRTIVADTAFALVKILVQVEQRLGLYFMGIVKTATVAYPKNYFSKWCDLMPSRGSFTVLSSTSDLGNETRCVGLRSNLNQ